MSRSTKPSDTIPAAALPAAPIAPPTIPVPHIMVRDREARTPPAGQRFFKQSGGNVVRVLFTDDKILSKGF